MPSTTSAFGSFYDSSAVGTVVWNNETNAASSNNSYATTNSLAIGLISHYLVAYNPSSLSIPSGATITGIKITVERKSLVDSTLKDYSVRLYKSSTLVGDNKADTSIWIPTSDTNKDYGGDGQMWGTTWTPSDFGSGFGVGISFTAPSSATFGYIDYVSVTVYYELTVTNTESITLAEAVQYLTGKALTEGISLADTIIMLMNATKSEAVTITDACEALIVSTLSHTESVNIGDFIEMISGRVLTEDLTVADSLIFLAKSIQTENLTLADTINFLSVIAKSETISIADSVLKLQNLVKTESITIADVMSSYIFVSNAPLTKYGTRLLVDMQLDSGTKYFSTEDIYITEN